MMRFSLYKYLQVNLIMLFSLLTVAFFACFRNSDINKKLSIQAKKIENDMRKFNYNAISNKSKKKLVKLAVESAEILYDAIANRATLSNCGFILQATRLSLLLAYNEERYLFDSIIKYSTDWVNILSGWVSLDSAEFDGVSKEAPIKTLEYYLGDQSLYAKLCTSLRNSRKYSDFLLLTLTTSYPAANLSPDQYSKISHENEFVDLLELQLKYILASGEPNLEKFNAIKPYHEGNQKWDKFNSIELLKESDARFLYKGQMNLDEEQMIQLNQIYEYVWLSLSTVDQRNAQAFVLATALLNQNCDQFIYALDKKVDNKIFNIVFMQSFNNVLSTFEKLSCNDQIESAIGNQNLYLRQYRRLILEILPLKPDWLEKAGPDFFLDTASLEYVYLNEIQNELKAFAMNDKEMDKVRIVAAKFYIYSAARSVTNGDVYYPKLIEKQQSLIHRVIAEIQNNPHSISQGVIDLIEIGQKILSEESKKQ
eukprot:NODE_473_length_7005_cov_0.742977.p1 type:complete len:481 gc:universal NODE_473_length_7005_cov_0.742977:4400-5842(+)